MDWKHTDLESKRWKKIAFILAVIFIVLTIVFIFDIGVFEISKPAVYFYPEEPTDVSVTLITDELIIVSDPGVGFLSPVMWNFLALPDSTVISNGNKYPYLYYETSYLRSQFSLSEGWSVSRAELGPSLHQKLLLLGLNEREAADFMEYWMSKLPEVPYYSIYLVQREQLDQKLNLRIVPEPDTFIRVLLVFKPTDSKEALTPPHILTPERDGFTVVEWGGILLH